VLVAKITPCFENGKVAHAKIPRLLGFGSTEFHVVHARPSHVDARYLFHYLRQHSIRRAGERSMTGSAGQKRVPTRFLSSLSLPLPTLVEQRRIAEVLDRADELRAKRRSAITHLDTLTHSIFLDMFGDAKRDDRSWPTVCFRELLTMPLRNGVSPSHGASVQAIVLTLSAITGGAFDASAQKVGTFHDRAAQTQLVDQRDLLICRGNGNIRLVGKGRFPPVSMPDVIFPDTMIAARIDADLAEPAFLEHLWNSDSVRGQLQRLARTTNGTFKVNQTMLEGVSIVAPPLALQRDFANRRRTIEIIRARYLASFKVMDDLYASLQHRAFRGEL
jgi:type I restriction enzyme S subunit